MNLQLLKSLSEAPGISGREERVREILKKALKDLCDEVQTDTLGNLIAIKKPARKNGSAKRVLIACHIDEIGFYVKHVDDKGFVRINAAGGFDTRNLFARRARVQASSGEELF